NDEPRTRDPLSWPLIVGLSSLALLWPLTGLWPVLGEGPLRAFVLIGITGAVGIGTVGFARVARPVPTPPISRAAPGFAHRVARRVLTLTICGAAHGFINLAVGGLLAGTGAIGAGPAMLMAFIPSLAMGAGVGGLAGLAAAGIQALLGRREER